MNRGMVLLRGGRIFGGVDSQLKWCVNRLISDLFARRAENGKADDRTLHGCRGRGLDQRSTLVDLVYVKYANMTTFEE